MLQCVFVKRLIPKVLKEAERKSLGSLVTFPGSRSLFNLKQVVRLNSHSCLAQVLRTHVRAWNTPQNHLLKMLRKVFHLNARVLAKFSPQNIPKCQYTHMSGFRWSVQVGEWVLSKHFRESPQPIFPPVYTYPAVQTNKYKQKQIQTQTNTNTKKYRWARRC